MNFVVILFLLLASSAFAQTKPRATAPQPAAGGTQCPILTGAYLCKKVVTDKSEPESKEEPLNITQLNDKGTTIYRVATEVGSTDFWANKEFYTFPKIQQVDKYEVHTVFAAGCNSGELQAIVDKTFKLDGAVAQTSRMVTTWSRNRDGSITSIHRQTATLPARQGPPLLFPESTVICRVDRSKPLPNWKY